MVDFGNLNKNHELSSNKNKKVSEKLEIEILKMFCFGEFVCLRSKMYAFKGEIEKKIEGVSELFSKTFNWRNTTIVYLVEKINKNVIIMLFDHIFMKRIFN